jgi:hypothetical protein
MKSNKEIKDLIGKYWECETTVSEENTLRSYFSQNEISEDLVEYKAVFQPMVDMQYIQSATDLSTSVPEAKIFTLNLRKYMYAIAAMLVLGICSIWIVKNNITDTNTNQMVEVQDPDEALRIATEALAMLSSKMNTGANAVEEKIHYVEKMNIIK